MADTFWHTIHLVNTEDGEHDIEILAALMDYSEDVADFIGTDGQTTQLSSWDYEQQEMTEFSKRYPKVLFEVVIDGGTGESDSLNYYQNGEYQSAREIRLFAPFRPGSPYEPNFSNNLFDAIEPGMCGTSQVEALPKLIESCHSSIQTIEGLVENIGRNAKEAKAGIEMIRELKRTLLMVEPRKLNADDQSR